MGEAGSPGANDFVFGLGCSAGHQRRDDSDWVKQRSATLMLRYFASSIRCTCLTSPACRTVKYTPLGNFRALKGT